VSTLQATAGQNADPQHLQLEIIPADAVLRAELFVPARAIGFVKAGQSVRLLYDAFPYQQFGTYRGQVAKASQTILTGSDVGGPIKLNEPAYRVNVALDRPDIDAYGQKIRLQPGMLLKADIILERRSLMRWLINPLLSVRM
jgi:membrane fusion protein